MKDQEDPVKTVIQFEKFALEEVDVWSNLQISLAYNEFVDKSDPFGFFESDPEPYKYLSFKEVKSSREKVRDESFADALERDGLPF